MTCKSCRRPAAVTALAGLPAATLGVAALVLAASQPLWAADQFQFRLIASDPVAGADASLSPDGRWIATSSRRGGHQNLWLYDINSGQWTQLTNSSSEDSEPAWSQDGSHIAFTSHSDGKRSIMTIRLADHELKEVAAWPENVDYPAWSPDGNSIVYTGGPWRARYFFRAPSDGGPPTYITAKPQHLGACSFHPDGKSLVCHTYENNHGNIVRLSLSGDVLERVTESSELDYKPSMSPDGREIVFSRAGEGSSTIWMHAEDSGAEAPLTQRPAQDRWPMFSRSGDELFFHRLVNDGGKILIFNRQTQALEILASNEEKPLQAAFDSTAQRVVYCATVNGHHVLRVIDRSTRQRRTLELGGDACFPRWSPDNSKLAFVLKSKDRWDVAVAAADGSGARVLTAKFPWLRGLNGPIDWSPDGTRILFMAESAPYETMLHVIDVRSGDVTALTSPGNFYESASWSPDGQSVVYMMARGGEWLWGLFQQSLGDKTVVEIAPSNGTEKNYPRYSADGRLVWMEVNQCNASEYLVEKDVAGKDNYLVNLPGGHWPSYSKDGREKLFTTIDHRVEFWLGQRIAGEVNARD